MFHTGLLSCGNHGFQGPIKEMCNGHERATKAQGKKTKTKVKKTASTNVKPVARPAARKPAVRPKKSKSDAVRAAFRYKCRVCGYVSSSLRGEPHNGIPAGTAFDDLPDTYVCPVCGFQGKGKIGTWGFDEWRPTRYLCSMCNYIYDEALGEPHRGINAGTKFEDLPDDYVCPVCALDPKISVQFGKVLKQGFDPYRFLMITKIVHQELSFFDPLQLLLTPENQRLPENWLYCK